jgi:hypothetical protein
MVESLGDFPKRNKILSFAKFTQAALLLLAGLPAVPLSRAQTYTVLYTFTGGTDGEFPAAALIQDSAGNRLRHRQLWKPSAGRIGIQAESERQVQGAPQL